MISSDAQRPVFVNYFLLCIFALGMITAYQEIKHCQLACHFATRAPGKQQVLGLLACPKKTVIACVESCQVHTSHRPEAVSSPVPVKLVSLSLTCNLCLILAASPVNQKNTH